MTKVTTQLSVVAQWVEQLLIKYLPGVEYEQTGVLLC
jgi:hypothetical protein